MSKFRVCVLVPRVIEVEAINADAAAQVASSQCMTYYGASRPISEPVDKVTGFLKNKVKASADMYAEAYLFPKISYVEAMDDLDAN